MKPLLTTPRDGQSFSSDPRSDPLFSTHNRLIKSSRSALEFSAGVVSMPRDPPTSINASMDMICVIIGPIRPCNAKQKPIVVHIEVFEYRLNN